MIRTLLASDGNAGDRFGSAVDFDGHTALVGSSLDDPAGDHSGSAYVFARQAAAWTQQAKLVASDAAAGDAFGSAVSVHAETAFVGAPFDSDAGNFSGSAYVFVRNGTSWPEALKLVAQDAMPGDRFGSSLSHAGGWLVIGAPLADDLGQDSGAAYVFGGTGSSWSEFTKLRAPDGVAGDRFGSAVVTRGETVVVAAPEDGGGGSVHVFRRQGSVFVHKQKLVPNAGGSDDRFGAALTLQDDVLVVGAPRTNAGTTDTGAANVYRFDGSNYVLETQLVAPGASTNDRLGTSVALAGERAMIGAAGDDFESGSVHVFQRNGTAWTHQFRLLAFDTSFDDNFSASMNVVGPWIVVGAHGDDDAGTDSGSAYVYALDGGPPGVPYCFGSGSGSCPCGNQAGSGRGCVHSGGHGMQITGAGTTSISADDLTLTAVDCPPQNTGLFYVGTDALRAGQVLFDGFQCVGGSVLRFPVVFQSTGAVSGDRFVRRDPSGTYFQPGTSYFFQYFSRDTAAGGTCTSGANFSPGYEVVMIP